MPQEFLKSALSRFQQYKFLAEQAAGQIDDQQFFEAIDRAEMSVAINVKHLSGNLRSRWTNFLSSDGEKPDRNRDFEFIISKSDSRASLMQNWDLGWTALFNTLQALKPADMNRSVRIRAHELSVIDAIHRQLTHYSYHVGQIVLIAKYLKGADWQSLSIAKGQSQAFNDTMFNK